MNTNKYAGFSLRNTLAAVGKSSSGLLRNTLDAAKRKGGLAWHKATTFGKTVGSKAKSRGIKLKNTIGGAAMNYGKTMAGKGGSPKETWTYRGATAVGLLGLGGGGYALAKGHKKEAGVREALTRGKDYAQKVYTKAKGAGKSYLSAVSGKDYRRAKKQYGALQNIATAQNGVPAADWDLYRNVDKAFKSTRNKMWAARGGTAAGVGGIGLGGYALANGDQKKEAGIREMLIKGKGYVQGAYSKVRGAGKNYFDTLSGKGYASAKEITKNYMDAAKSNPQVKEMPFYREAKNLLKSERNKMWAARGGTAAGVGGIGLGGYALANREQKKEAGVREALTRGKDYAQKVYTKAKGVGRNYWGSVSGKDYAAAQKQNAGYLRLGQIYPRFQEESAYKNALNEISSAKGKMWKARGGTAAGVGGIGLGGYALSGRKPSKEGE